MPVQRPRARDDLDVAVRNIGGEETIVVGDSIRNEHMQLDPVQYTVFKLLDGKRSLADLCLILAQDFDIEVDVDELEAFVDTLGEMGLLDVSSDLRIDEADGEVIARKVAQELASSGVVFALRSESQSRRGGSRRGDRRHRHDEAILFDGAIKNLRAGRIREAAAFLRAVLDERPDNKRARYLLHLLAAQHLGKPIEKEGLFWRYPLFNPDRVLTVLDRLCGWLLISPLGLLAVLLGVVSATALLFLNFDRVLRDVQMFLNPLWILSRPHLLFTVIAMERVGFVLVHELMHGLTCKHFGGRVREIGIFGRLMPDGAYCDVSATHLMDSRWHRIAVALAGPLHDAAVWALGIWLWYVTDSGTFLGAFGFYISAVFIFRVFFNANPLFHSDGYLILIDLLDYANLRSDAFEYTLLRIRRFFFGGGVEIPEELEARGRLLLAYAIPAAIVTTLFISISTYYVTKNLMRYLQTLGLLIALSIIGPMVWGLVKPVVLVVWNNRALFWRQPRFRVATLVLVAGVVTILSLPRPLIIEAPCEVAPVLAKVRAPHDGRIATLHVGHGERVEPGTVLLQLDDRAQRHALALANARLREAELRLVGLLSGARDEELDVERARVAAAGMRVAAASKRAAQTASMLRKKLIPLSQHEIAVADLAAARAERSNALAALDAKASGASAAELSAARANVAAASADVAHAEREVERSVLVSPIAGVVLWRVARPWEDPRGASVKAGDEVLWVRPFETPHIEARVPLSAPVSLIDDGTPAEVLLDGTSAGPVRGRVRHVANRIDDESRSREDFLDKHRGIPQELAQTIAQYQGRPNPWETSFLRVTIELDEAELLEEAPIGLGGEVRIEQGDYPLAWHAFVRLKRIIELDLQEVLGLLT